ncbi:MAG: hypothetical protein J0M12_13465 [Deltaproteobacteria bacterium]|nr:hypothetical protein [Deltaproteobacteria bacterium]
MRNQKGATLVETVIVLPLFLFGVLYFIWWAVTINERTALETGVGNAIRLAATRGNPGLVRKKLISQVHAWNEAGDGVAPTGYSPVEELLIWPPAAWNDVKLYFNDDMIAPLLGVEPLLSAPYFQKLPPEYIYTIIYVLQSLRQSIGNSIRFPCDPSAPDGAGCVLCKFLNPVTLDSTPLTSNSPAPSEIPRRTIALECTYKPASHLLGPLRGMLSAISGPLGGPSGFQFKVKRVLTFNSGIIEEN